jgi:hypothetical protein
MKSVYFAVRTGPLNKTVYALSVKGKELILRRIEENTYRKQAIRKTDHFWQIFYNTLVIYEGKQISDASFYDWYSVRNNKCRPRWHLACWDCRFESHRGHGCLSVVSVECCQVKVSATSWSLVQRSPTVVVRRCVWSRNLVNEEALAHWGLSRQK